MDYNAVANFIWFKNPEIREHTTTFEELLSWLKNQRSIVIYDKGKITGVGLYLVDKRKIHCHFISISVGAGQTGVGIIKRGIKEIIKKYHPRFVSWLNPDFNLITMEIK